LWNSRCLSRPCFPSLAPPWAGAELVFGSKACRLRCSWAWPHRSLGKYDVMRPWREISVAYLTFQLTRALDQLQRYGVSDAPLLYPLPELLGRPNPTEGVSCVSSMRFDGNYPLGRRTVPSERFAVRNSFARRSQSTCSSPSRTASLFTNVLRFRWPVLAGVRSRLFWRTSRHLPPSRPRLQVAGRSRVLVGQVNELGTQRTLKNFECNSDGESAVYLCVLPQTVAIVLSGAVHHERPFRRPVPQRELRKMPGCWRRGENAPDCSPAFSLE